MHSPSPKLGISKNFHSNLYHLPRQVLTAFCVLIPCAFPTTTQGQTSQRWFQIEVSVFSNESFTDRNEELWQSERLQLEYPNPLRKLKQLSDLLLTEELISADSNESEGFAGSSLNELNRALNEFELAAEQEEIRLASILATGPKPARAGGDFRFFDFLRDSHLQLRPQDSDFQQTNRALERSAEHRLLFHAQWRESLSDPSDAIPLYVQGGSRYGDQHELQGSITLRFNENRDRIVIDANLWLTEFSAALDLNTDWNLPEIPEQMKSPSDRGNDSVLGLKYGINRVFHLQQSRGMRSTEFHYIDHPAMGIVILVEPYEVPPLPLPQFNFEVDN